MSSSRLAVKPVSRSQQQSKLAFLGREESWQDVQPQSANTDAASVAHSSFSFGSRAIEDFFPLKSMADRISAQVEDFAIAVDQWSVELEKLRSEHDAKQISHRSHELTVALVAQLQNIVRVTTEDLKKKKLRGTSNLSKSWRKRIDDVAKVADEEEDDGLPQSQPFDEAEAKAYHQLQSELNTWELFQTLVDIRHHDPSVDFASSKHAYSMQRGAINPQTPGPELWERYLIDDDEAREKRKILQWLENCTDTSDTTFDVIVEELEAKAGTGNGTWSHGWLNTRQKIKAAKMVKSASGAMTTSTLDIPNSSRTGQLVSQLDPDVRARQHRLLEQPDELYERSLWLACFAMLRRGMTWQQVREWCEERNEGWRAASLGMTKKEQTSRYFVDEPNAGALWRRMCYAVARQSNADKYERAVYGLLAGDVQSVEPACHSWDDHLYVHYNAVLVYGFEQFLLKHCPSRLPSALTSRFPLSTPITGISNSAQIIEKLGQQQSTQMESRTPTKIIQGALIAQTFVDFVHQLGIAIAGKINSRGHKDELIPPTDETSVDQFGDIVGDYNVIRTVVHIYIIYSFFAESELSPEARDYIQNVIVYYMDFLRRIGKVESLPTYAKFISIGRREHVLGTIMADVINNDEQRQLVSLMASEKINLPQVIKQQLQHSLHRMDTLPGTFANIEELKMVEETKDPRWPGLRISQRFVQTPLDDLEAGTVRAAEWYLIVASRWKETFSNLTLAMKNLLLAGQWSAALAMTKAVPFHDLSILKSQAYFEGRPIDVFSPEDEDMLHAIDEEEAATAADAQEATQHEFRRTTRASRRAVSEQPDGPPASSSEQLIGRTAKRKLTLMKLQQESKRLLEMQQLCLILERLSAWRLLEDQAPVNAYGPLSLGEFKRRLRDELEELEAAMLPMLIGGFMANATGSTPAENYIPLIEAYIPNILLAYNSALIYASIYLGPETILRSFALANALALDSPTSLPDPTISMPTSPGSGDNQTLSIALASTAKLHVMVAGFAYAAKMLLKLNQEEEWREKAARKAEGDAPGGQPRKKKVKRRSSLKRRGWAGETLGIWDPNPGSGTGSE